LHSLVLTFEGQSELITSSSHYSGLRLCTINEELISDPVALDEEDADSVGPWTWNITFNMRIPGWLPPSDVFGDCSSTSPGTKYFLFATAKLSLLEESPSSWITACAPFISQFKYVEARAHQITVNRYAVSRTTDASWPLINCLVTPLSSMSSKGSRSIPSEILQNLEILVGLPQRVSVKHASFPFVIRLRAPQLEEHIAARLRIPGFTASLNQVEKYE
jgi:hypothetical protein